MARNSGPSTTTYVLIGIGTAAALAGAYAIYRWLRSEPASEGSMRELRRSGRKVRRSIHDAAHGVGEEAYEGAKDAGASVGDFAGKARKTGEMAARNVGYEGATEV